MVGCSWRDHRGKLKHPVWGVILCALAAAIKVPAGLGVVYVAWDWLGTDLPCASGCDRWPPPADRGRSARGTLDGERLGWGWVANLATPGTVRSWVAPATGVGMAISGLAHAFGLNLSLGGVLSVTRVLGLAAPPRPPCTSCS